MATERKCPNCQTWNKNNDYCTECNTLLSPVIIEQEREKEREKRRYRPPSKLDIFIDKWKNSRFLIMRILFKIVYSVAVIFFSIASFFAWLAASPNG